MADMFVPFHGYSLKLDDGREIEFELTNEEDRSNVIRSCGKVRWDDPANNNPEIQDVFDCESEDHLDPVAWYDECVRPYVRKVA